MMTHSIQQHNGLDVGRSGCTFKQLWEWSLDGLAIQWHLHHWWSWSSVLFWQLQLGSDRCGRCCSFAGLYLPWYRNTYVQIHGWMIQLRHLCGPLQLQTAAEVIFGQCNLRQKGVWMDISHLKCRTLHLFWLWEAGKAFSTRKGSFYFKPDGFCLDCWQFGRIWSLLDHWRNLLMLEAFKRLFGGKWRCFGLQKTAKTFANPFDFNGLVLSFLGQTWACYKLA